MSSEITVGTWTWRGYKIGYRYSGDRTLPTGIANRRLPIVFVHGFGASSGHWRKNLPVLGQHYRCWAIDLLGFGASAKPKPGGDIAYTFETWGEQVADFCNAIVGEPVVLVGNSIGCIVAMQTAVTHPELVRGLVAINFSLRMLHERKRASSPWHQRLSTPVIQKLLAYPPVGKFFFSQIAKPKVVRNLLRQAYKRPEAVTDELIDIILEPARDPGAADVFVAFTGNSKGPLPEDLLPRLSCPAVVFWGTDDPWEPVALGREVTEAAGVEFVPLKGLGHCPQDEAPEVVNPIVQQWLDRLP